MPLPHRITHRWQRWRLSLLLAAASLVGGCLAPVMTSPTPPRDASAEGWTPIAPGLEQRTLQPPDSAFTTLTIVRVDPARYSFRAHYRPGDPLTLQAWRDTLPDAVAFVNTNFFTLQNTITGLLVADGVVHGQSFTDRGGMLFVQNGRVDVRSLIAQPYRGEALEQAVQAFPMLVTDGRAAYTTTRGDSPSRRTAAAIDSNGNLLLIITSSLFGIRLADFSTFLATSNLGIVNAVNLDGGGSTLLYSGRSQIISRDPVPAIWAVYAR